MNVFIAENSQSLRDSLQSVLSDMPEVKVVGQAINETRAIECIGELQPDVVILDIGLQSGSGISVLEHVKKHHCTIKVIVLSHYADDTCIERCRRAGADYLFEKSNQLMQLRRVLSELVCADLLGIKFSPH